MVSEIVVQIFRYYTLNATNLDVADTIVFVVLVVVL